MRDSDICAIKGRTSAWPPLAWISLGPAHLSCLSTSAWTQSVRIQGTPPEVPPSLTTITNNYITPQWTQTPSVNYLQNPQSSKASQSSKTDRCKYVDSFQHSPHNSIIHQCQPRTAIHRYIIRRMDQETRLWPSPHTHSDGVQRIRELQGQAYP